MAVRIERGRVTVTHSEYCWVRFNEIMDFSLFVTCGSFCLTNTVVSFWLHWLPTQSRQPLKCTPWQFHLVSTCLHAGFICIFLVAQYRYHSATQPQLRLDIFIISAYICICLSLTHLKNAYKWWCLEIWPGLTTGLGKTWSWPWKLAELWVHIRWKQPSFALVNCYVHWWWDFRRHMQLLCAGHTSIISIEHEGESLIQNEMLSIKTNKMKILHHRKSTSQYVDFLPCSMEGCNGVMVSPASSWYRAGSGP